MTAPVADFTGSPTTVSAGSNITFTDNSTNTPTSWSWSFPGGTPATSTNQNPLITYYSAGIYSVSLIATNMCGSDTETKTEYITVSEPVTSQIFTTPGESTFTVPDNVYQITVQVWGGGGNGGAVTAHLGAGGGGGGAYSSSKLSVIPGESYDLWVGQGSVSLANGEDSWFGSATTVMAKGGEFGGSNSISAGKGGSADMGYGDIRDDSSIRRKTGAVIFSSSFVSLKNCLKKEPYKGPIEPPISIIKT